jgi:hypothetical protein
MMSQSKATEAPREPGAALYATHGGTLYVRSDAVFTAAPEVAVNGLPGVLFHEQPGTVYLKVADAVRYHKAPGREPRPGEDKIRVELERVLVEYALRRAAAGEPIGATYAVCGGELYLATAASGVPALVLEVGALTVTTFGEEGHRTPYVKVEDAARWHAEAIDATEGVEGSLRVKALLEQALAGFRAGTFGRGGVG